MNNSIPTSLDELLFEAVRDKDAREVKVLLELGATPLWQESDGTTALHYAAALEDTEILQDLLAHPRIKVNQPDEDGVTALHAAAKAGRTAAIEKLAAHAGIEIDARDTWGATPLMTAAHHGKTQAVTLLKKKGADINAKDNSKRTAMHYAVSRDYLETLQEIGRLGGDATMPDKNGITPIDLADRKDLKQDIPYRIAQFLNAAAVQKSLRIGVEADIEPPPRARFVKKTKPQP